MAPNQEGGVFKTSQPNEESPLLGGESSEHADNGTIERQDEQPNTEDGDVPLAEEPSTAKLIVVLGSIWIGVFISALDMTIVATLSSPISSSFDSFTLLSWLATAYLVANAGVQPLSGKLTDIFSRRTGLIWSNIFFATGTLICGLARDEWFIIFGRVVAGVGGGCLNTIATFVASDLVPLRRRALWQGYGNIFYGLGAGIGGIFGGFITDVWNWRWAFLIQVPVIIVSGCIVVFTVKIPVKETNKARLKRVDFVGAITLVLTLVLLLIGLNSGGNIVPWNHPLVYTSLPLAGVLLLGFVYVEDRVASEPIIPVRLLLDRTVAAACLANWFASMAYFSALYYGPIFFQIQGLTPTEAGERLVPSAVGASVGSLGTGIIMRSTGRYYLLNVAGTSSFVLAAALLVGFLDFNVATWLPFVILFLGGTGFGAILTITLLALISAVDHKYQAVITSASYAFRSTGSTIGITISSAVFQNVLKAKLWDYVGDAKGAAEIVKKVRDNIDAVKDLPPSLKEKVQHAYMDALQSVWWAILAMTITAMAVSLLMRENVLHTNLARK